MCDTWHNKLLFVNDTAHKNVAIVIDDKLMTPYKNLGNLLFLICIHYFSQWLD
jgi:hypothetical protein